MRLWTLFATFLINFVLLLTACSSEDKNAGGTSEAENSIAIIDKQVAGVSQKGPFTKGSTVTLYELNFRTRAQTGKSFLGKISDSTGSFSINKIELASQYALLRADGYYRNEITGKISASQITLNAISDLSERDNVNINLLTHLEYDRAVWLAQENEITIKNAKVEADREIFAAFGLEYDGDRFEDLDIFGKDDADAALLAISVIMHSGRSEGEFSLALADLAMDLEKDGKWDDAKAIAEAADYSFEADTIQIRKNMEAWNIAKAIPDFAPIVEHFWNDAFGLGRCTEKREGETRPDSNSRSRYFEKKFICEKTHWRLLGAKQSSSSSISAESSNSSAESSNTTTSSSSVASSSSSAKEGTPSSSSVKRSSSSRQSTAIIDPPYKEETSVIDPEALAILGTCNGENEGAVKKAFNVSFVCKSELWYSLLLADMEQDSWFNPNITYGSLTDQRDGQTYRTVVIGTQKWMAENLHYGGENASVKLAANMADENLCPSGDEKYCEKAGYVYTWTAAMNLSPTYRSRVVSSYPITSNHQGICPDGWHVPSKEEWNTLLEYVKYTYNEGVNAIKATDSWVWFSEDVAPTNVTGFSMLATGMTSESWGRIDMGVSTAFISGDVPSIVLNMPYLTIQEFFYNENKIKEFNSSDDAFSVRCIENKTVPIGPPYNENTSIIDPEILAILGTCNNDNEGTVRKAYDNSFICKSGLWYSQLIADMEQGSQFNSSITYGTLTDERDGQTYKTVVIGTQKWMAENLHYAGENASEELAINMADEILCPSGNEALCKKTGYVYSWTAAVNISPLYQQRQATSLPIGDEHQGICPDGWHIPTLDEWYALLEYVAPLDYHGGTHALKSQDSWIYNDKEYIPTNSTGFSAIATGCDYNWEQGKCAAFHTASYNTSENCSGGNFYYWTDQADFGGRASSTLASVRCVENAAP